MARGDDTKCHAEARWRGGRTAARRNRELDDLAETLIDAAIQIHRDLGSAWLESVHEAVLARALEQWGLQVQRQTAVRFEYDGLVFD